MKLIIQILLVVLAVATGITFLYSAYTKLNPIRSFEYTIVEYAHLPWLASALLARLLIGLEAALGGLILLHFFGTRKWVLKAAIIITVIFSIYLLYLWATVGNDVNCGCFGDNIWMSPFSSLIKNAVLIAALIILARYHRGWKFKASNIVTTILFVIVTALPFVLYGLPDQTPAWSQTDRFQIDLSALYTPGKADAPKADLRKGKHVIAFLSYSCPHCRIAARKMHIMKEKNPSLPFHLIVAGKEKYMASFWKETGAEHIPNTRLSADEFTALAGYSWPVIYWINNGWVEAQTTYISMEQSDIEAWLQKP